MLGPRRGRYSGDGMPAAIPGHNAVLVLFACLLALMGWFGLNAAGAILFNGVPPERVALVFVNTTLSAAAAALVSAALTRARFGRPDPSLCANAWIGGLVTSSAGSAFIGPAVAALAGAVGGALVTLAVEWLDFHLEVDDPGGSISAHAVGGIWGLVALGFFGRIAEAGQARGPTGGRRDPAGPGAARLLRLELAARPLLSPAHLSRGRTAGPGSLRTRRRGPIPSSSSTAKISISDRRPAPAPRSSPPKAKELESANSTCAGRAVGNHVQIALRVRLVEIGGGRQHAVAQGHDGGQAFERAGRAQGVAMHGFGGTDRQPLGVRAENRARMAAVSVESLASVPVPCALM